MPDSTDPRPPPAFVAEGFTQAGDGYSVFSQIDATVARRIFLLWAILAGVAAAIMAATASPWSNALLVPIGLFLAVAAAAVRLARRMPDHPGDAITALMATSLLAQFINIAINGSSIASPGLTFLPLLVMLCAVMDDRPARAFGFTALCAIGVLVLGWHASMTLPDNATDGGGVPVLRRVLVELLALVAALTFGRLTVRALRKALRDQREQAQRAQYGSLFHLSPVPQVLHRDGRIIDANAAAAQLFGYEDAAAMRGVALSDHHLEGPDRERLHARLRQLQGMRTPPVGPGDTVSYRLVNRAGAQLDVRARSVPLEFHGSGPILSTYIDDTALLAAERAVKDAQVLMQHIITASPYGISLTEFATGRVLIVNEAFERITGYRSEELVGRTSAEIGLWKSQAEWDEIHRAVTETGSAHAVRVAALTQEGRERLLEGSFAKFGIGGSEYLIIMVSDVTDAVAAEMRRRTVMDAVPVGIVAVSQDRITLCSRSFERMVGWPDRSGAGRDLAALLGGEAAVREVHRLTDEPLQRGESASFVWPLRDGDGKPFTARFTGHVIDPEQLDAHRDLVWIVQDVTLEIERERLLERARLDAKAAAQAKSRFLIHTSHQLRTPMNAILNLAELATAPDTKPAQREDLVRHMADSAQKLALMLGDIMDLQLLEEGELHLDPHPFDLGDLADTVRASWSTPTVGHGMHLSVHLGPGTDRWVQGDAHRLRQLLGCYLSNALRHAGMGSIVLNVRALGEDHYRFEVQDQGPGIPLQDQERLFTPFPALSDAAAAAGPRQGVGLGLALARRLAQAMGGSTGVVSEPGKGSTFWAEVPLPPASAPRPASGQDEKPLTGFRLLLAEDDELSAASMTMLLEHWGAHVDAVSDGAQAVRAVANARDDGRPFDLLLMDLDMPLMDGLEATRWIREQLHEDSVPVIALTAGRLAVEIDSAEAAGCSDFLSKPVPARQLLERVMRQITRRQQPA